MRRRVLGLEGGERLLGLASEGDAEPRPLVVGRKLDEAQRVAGRVAAVGVMAQA